MYGISIMRISRLEVEALGTGEKIKPAGRFVKRGGGHEGFCVFLAADG